MSFSDVIVVVDDDESILLVFEAILNSLGFLNVKCFGSPIKAVDFINKQKELPLFLFVDFMMPAMNGIDLLDKIIISDKENLKCCIVSGHSGNINREEFNFIRKPFSIQEIEELLRKEIVS